MPKTQKEKTRQSKELYRQKTLLFQRLKKIHKDCDVSMMTVMVTAAGVVHVQCTPDLETKIRDCMQPLVEFIMQKRQLSKSRRREEAQPAMVETVLS